MIKGISTQEVRYGIGRKMLNVFNVMSDGKVNLQQISLDFQTGIELGK